MHTWSPDWKRVIIIHHSIAPSFSADTFPLIPSPSHDTGAIERMMCGTLEQGAICGRLNEGVLPAGTDRNSTARAYKDTAKIQRYYKDTAKIQRYYKDSAGPTTGQTPAADAEGINSDTPHSAEIRTESLH